MQAYRFGFICTIYLYYLHNLWTSFNRCFFKNNLWYFKWEFKFESLLPHQQLKISSSLKTLTYLTQASLVGSVASYALTIYLAGYLGTEKSGLYSYILAIAGFSTIIITYATDQTAPSLVSKGVSLQTIFNNVLSIRLLWFVLIMVILILWKWNEPVVLFGALIINLSSFNTSYYHEINRDNTKYAVIYLFERLLYVLIIVAVNLVSQVNIVTILLVYFFIVSLSLYCNIHIRLWWVEQVNYRG